MKMLFVGLLATLGLGLAGCHSSPSSETTETSGTTAAALLTPGPWRGELSAQGQKIPFLFEVKAEAGKPVVYLINKGLNGEERLRCDEISAAGDSVTVRLHVFDAALVLRGDGKGKVKGTWVKYDAKEPYRVPLTAMTAEVALATSAMQPLNERKVGDFSGTWMVRFRDETGKTYPAVGIFKADPDPAKRGQYTGTFLTTTGDYRYLAGNASRDFELANNTSWFRLTLSTFDGNHAFFFSGKSVVADADYKEPVTEINGHFYTGKAGYETWTAIRDDHAKLPDADTLTYLKKGESRLNFKFPSIFEGGSISPADPKYRGKVVVVQLLGSWCPNCLDESNFLAPWYEKNKHRGVEIIGLGYERSGDYAQASARLRKLRERLHIGYDLAVAGVSNKDSVAKSLPQLAKFLAFPTTIFLDKKGNVRKIRTGYSGPGTGKYYQEETAAFEREVSKLLAE